VGPFWANAILKPFNQDSPDDRMRESIDMMRVAAIRVWKPWLNAFAEIERGSVVPALAT